MVLHTLPCPHVHAHTSRVAYLVEHGIRRRARLLQSFEEDIGVGEDQWRVRRMRMEQAPGARSNGRAATTSIGVGAIGSSAVWSESGSSAGRSAVSDVGGA